MTKPLAISLLWFDDCPNHDAARELLDSVLADRGIDAEITAVNVSTPAIGLEVQFAGSPTIRVEGVDVEPDYVDSGDYTPRCRLYSTPHGLAGVPEREWIEAAVDRAVSVT